MKVQMYFDSNSCPLQAKCSKRMLTAQGFTLVELMVASVIVSVALLGVFSLVRQASEVEARSHLVWRSRGPANAMADHLESALEHAVVSGDLGGGGIQAQPDGNGGYRLRLLVAGAVYDHTPGEPEGGTRWLEYRWYPELKDENAAGDASSLSADDSLAYRVELRSALLAGDTLLNRDVSSRGNDAANEVDWDRIEPIVLAREFKSVELAFRSVAEGQWQPRYEGSPGTVIARLRIRAGDETIERIIYPRVSPSDDGGGQEQAGGEAAEDAQ